MGSEVPEGDPREGVQEAVGYLALEVREEARLGFREQTHPGLSLRVYNIENGSRGEREAFQEQRAMSHW